MENEQIHEAQLLTDQAYTWESVEHFPQEDLNNQNEKETHAARDFWRGSTLALHCIYVSLS